jgi:glutathione peroxidase
MAAVIAALGRFIYPLRKVLNKLFRGGIVLSHNPTSMLPFKSIHEYKITGINGNEIDFARYRGKKMLLVNTASECGFTPQYAQLQTLHERYPHTLVVIGLPSNDFGAQEPGNEKEILRFCEANYGVTFPLTKKIFVTGPGKHDVFQWLTNKELNGWNDREPNWNFCKYLVDEHGTLTDFFSHKMDPLDARIISKIEQASLPLQGR